MIDDGHEYIDHESLCHSERSSPTTTPACFVSFVQLATLGNSPMSTPSLSWNGFSVLLRRGGEGMRGPAILKRARCICPTASSASDHSCCHHMKYQSSLVTLDIVQHPCSCVDVVSAQCRRLTIPPDTHNTHTTDGYRCSPLSPCQSSLWLLLSQLPTARSCATGPHCGVLRARAPWVSASAGRHADAYVAQIL